jgi:hypothetical protein
MSKQRTFSFRSRLSFKSLTGDDTALSEPSSTSQGLTPALQRGMNRLDEPTVLLSTALSCSSTIASEHNVDVIAIHGLNGHGFKTFTHANEKIWLRDFLPKDLPGARVYSYSYDSAVMFSRNTDTIRDYGRRLLENIRLIRSTKEVI